MPVRYRLPNGLTVVFEEHHAARVAAFQVWVDVGSADERPDQVGLAHLHEHMLFKGTRRRGPGEVAKAVEAHGGEINAWTSFDQTVYHVVIASQYARMGLDVLADSIRSSAFDPGELSREIEVVCEEIKRSLDLPARRASKDLFAQAFRVHPYQRQVIGDEASVRSHTRQKVLDFYETHYAPSNLVLAIAGDLTEAQVRAWVDELFGGDWGRPGAPKPPRPVEPAASERRLLFREEDVKEAHVHLGFHIPDVRHPDAAALDVLAMLAGQGDASRLVLSLKRQLALVNGISCYAYTPKDPGLLGVSLMLDPQHLKKALEETVRELVQLSAEAAPEEELSTVKALIEAEAVYQRETVQGQARKLGYYESGAGGIEVEARYYAQIAQLTPEDIRAAAARYLRFDRLVLTGLLPSGSGFDAAKAEAVLSSALATRPAPRPARRALGQVETPPMRVTAPLSARRGDGKAVVERLPSGATVVVREESQVPLFAVRAIFPGGLRYETQASNGLSTLVCRLLTRGTAQRDFEQIARLIDDLAGTLSGAGGRNTVSLRGEFLSRHFERALALFTEVLTEPTFPEAELAKERAHLLQDIHSRDDKPSGVAFDLFARTLFERHPYRLSTLGEAPAVERLIRDDLLRYHREHMDPSQMVLCVVGDVKTERVLELAQRSFGRTLGRAAPAPAVSDEPAPSQPREARRQLPRAQAHVVLGFRGVSVTDPARRPLEVLSTVLSGQGGRLFVELRDKRSIAYSVSSLAMEGIDPGYFATYIGTSPEKVDQALAGIREELAKVRDELVPADELERAKQHLIGTHEIALQRNGSRAAQMSLDQCYGLGADHYLGFAEQISAVTAEEVQQVARRIIDFQRSALAIVGP